VIKKKILFIIIGIILIPILAIYISGAIFAILIRSPKSIEAPKELKQLEKVIDKEIGRNGNVIFYGVERPEYNNCHAKFQIGLMADTVSITKDNIDEYIKFVNKRVLQNLKDKNCIDSITINAGINGIRNEKGVLIEKRYSFSVK
jgi:single-stranded DNA-specific DHH superfamily exonuclease